MCIKIILSAITKSSYNDNFSHATILQRVAAIYAQILDNIKCSFIYKRVHIYKAWIFLQKAAKSAGISYSFLN